MMTLIIKSYLAILLSIGVGSIFIFALGVYWIYQGLQPKSQHDSDYAAIAGDDILATQLDLARAYIEIDNKTSAKKILDSILSKGSHSQQEEAQRLLSYL